MTVYLIWSFEHRKWWGANGRGYVDDVVYAGHYSRKQAEAICLQANISAVNDAMVPLPDDAVIRIARGRST